MTAENISLSEEQVLSFVIPGWANWVAQDESGVWWAYSVEPLRNDYGWYENEVGMYFRLGMSEPINWAGSVSRVKNGKVL